MNILYILYFLRLLLRLVLNDFRVVSQKTAALALFVCLFPVAVDASTLDLSFQQIVTGIPGSTVTFLGTMTNNSSANIFVNGLYTSDPSANIVIDTLSFFDRVPTKFAPSTSFTGELFTASIGLDAVPGEYIGSFEIQGGGNSAAFDTLASNTLTVFVTPVPEPSISVFILLGMLALCLTFKNRRKQFKG